jgi:hypothetical protein
LNGYDHGEIDPVVAPRGTNEKLFGAPHNYQSATMPDIHGVPHSRSQLRMLLVASVRITEAASTNDSPSRETKTYNTFPDNGRTLTDDAFDSIVRILTSGKVAGDEVGPHKDLIADFPYLGPPHKAFGSEPKVMRSPDDKFLVSSAIVQHQTA